MDLCPTGCANKEFYYVENLQKVFCKECDGVVLMDVGPCPHTKTFETDYAADLYIPAHIDTVCEKCFYVVDSRRGRLLA